jgi:hypothetical protein
MARNRQRWEKIFSFTGLIDDEWLYRRSGFNAAAPKENPVPTERKQIRLILDAGTERQVIDLARREGRSVSAMANRLVTQQLAARRSAAAENDELLRIGHAVKLENTLVKVLRGEAPEAAHD